MLPLCLQIILAILFISDFIELKCCNDLMDFRRFFSIGDFFSAVIKRNSYMIFQSSNPSSQNVCATHDINDLLGGTTVGNLL